MIHVLSCHTLASIQDLGRYGWRRFGVGHAGAMDRLALKAGNLLLNNPDNAAAMEIALGGLSVRFERDMPFCLTGALYEAYLDDEPIHSYWRYSAKKGQVLRLIRAVHGMYAYLCVDGGFDVPEILNAKATDLKAQFGGHQGRALQQGDNLPVLGETGSLKKVGIAPIPFTNQIHALPSSEYEQFSRNAHFRFWQNGWTLQSDSNRMGYRFHGGMLERVNAVDMLSHAVQFGTVQVPPSGQPIILMADTQTTGGYPKIATIAEADLGRLAQIRFGAKVFFKITTPQEAQNLHRKNQVYLRQIQQIVQAI